MPADKPEPSAKAGGFFCEMMNQDLGKKKPRHARPGLY